MRIMMAHATRAAKIGAHLSRRIVSACMKRMTATDAEHTAETAAHSPIFLDRLNEILTARGAEPAVAAQQWAEQYLVQPNDGDHQPTWRRQQGGPHKLHYDRSDKRRTNRAVKRGSE